MPEPSPIEIEFDDVSLTLGATPVLCGLSLRVHRGETKVLLGEAGAGKSVALKLAIGLMRPDQGRITVLGEPVSEMNETALYELRRRIGIVFQESALFDSLTVRDNVAYRLDQEHRMEVEAVDARVRACLDAVELSDVMDKFPVELSGGMQRRVAIARALATEPEIMLFDSPTAGLDPITATAIMEQIIRLRDVQQVTSLLVTHRIQDAAMLASFRWDPVQNALRPVDGAGGRTSFLVLHDQHAVFDGSATALRASTEPYVQRFLQGT